MTDVWTLLRARARASGASPFVTFVDVATRERTELSATSLENAAAKIANALRDEFDLDPGAVVGLHVPVHWQRAAWCAGVWTAGCVVAPEGRNVDLLVAGPAQAAALAADGSEVAVVSLHPYGLPIREDLPRGAGDVTVAVRQQPDAYLFDPPSAVSPAWLVEGRTLDQSELLDEAARLAATWGVVEGGRLLADDRVEGAPAWLAALAVPLVARASVVLVRGDGERVADQERVTSRAR